VEIRTEEAVDQIRVHEGSVAGVRLESGESIDTRCVLANADVRQVYEMLLSEDRKARSVRRKLAKESLSSSAFILLLGVKKQHPDLVHHNIFFSPDYQSEFEQIFKHEVPPSAPTIYVAITSKETARDAPPGCENWYVMVNVPAVSQEWDWDQQKESYKERVISSLADRGYDLTGLVEQEQVITPLDLAQQNGAWAGAIYGGSSNDRWAAFRRAHNRARYPRGLYLVGGTVHPGGGMPMAALSGEVASRMIMADFPAE
jgi:phytoene desaturase